jgi:peptide/nickel transport system substrate-binding protein
MNFKEKLAFFSLLLIFVGSFLSWGLFYYYSKTKAVPTYGGEYIEGIVGQPLHLNPLLSGSNQTDADISRLVYSGLFKYDGQGNLVPDLAESYDLSDDKTTYTVHLKKNILWHDGETLDSSDVAFTVNLLADPAYKSTLRSNWQGIDTQIIDNSTIQFKIPAPYVGFLNNLTFGVLPKHIWESITPDNFSLSSLNLEPIGSGPYKYDSIQKDSKGNIISYKLISNPSYFDGKPFISKVTFNFYADDDSALGALNRKEIMGLNSLTAQKISAIKNQKSVAVNKFQIPRYFGVFFNQTKSIPLANDEVRTALDLATNRQEIIGKVLSGNGQPAFSPFLPGMVGYSTDIGVRDFNLDQANQLLDQKGWTKGQDGFRAKNNVALTINIVTTDWEELAQTADILKSQWEKVGAKVTVSSYSISDIQQNYIRPREYEALLFGQVVGADPDPYSFWHSNQKKDPGLNLSLYGDSNIDKLIEQGRTEFDLGKRAQDYIDFQKALVKEVPAVFLYSPEYIYPIGKNVQGINIETLISPSDRFADINHWYIKTKRVRK